MDNTTKAYEILHQMIGATQELIESANALENARHMVHQRLMDFDDPRFYRRQLENNIALNNFTKIYEDVRDLIYKGLCDAELLEIMDDANQKKYYGGYQTCVVPEQYTKGKN